MRQLAASSPLALAALVVTLAAPAAATGFAVSSTSVAPSTYWEINRPIEVDFNAPVDFASVNLSTIRIATQTGAPAAGAYELVDADTVRFVPVCPTLPDLSDAGFVPGSRYVLEVADPAGGGPVVHSAAGLPLRQGVTVPFWTRPASDPAVFLDFVPGPPAPVIAPGTPDACHLELGNGARVDFATPAVVDPALGAATPAGFRAPLNLYADARSRVAVVVVLDQPIAVASLALEPDRVRLEYEASPGLWARVTATLELVANCSGAGARIRVVPQGVLPQGRRVRTVLAAELADLVGDALGAPLVVGTFPVGVAHDPGTTAPGDGADQAAEDFSSDAFEDADASFDEPIAVWRGGQLVAATFPGTGGPGGNFDWTISGTLVLSTTFSVIQNAQQTATQNVVNGLVDVRHLRVLPGAVLVVQGPNPVRIRASGDVTIEGQVRVSGSSSNGVVTLNTTTLPEPGASGQCGGGRGGTGNVLTTQSTPQGQAGYGHFDHPLGGGGGGESAFNPIPDDNQRRAAGGGGGRLGADAARPNAPNHGFLVANPSGCPDQTAIGLDVEPGQPGWPTAQGPLPPFGPPAGGGAGPSPFADADPANDFWGTLRTSTGAIVRGELVAPIAGAGGGAGGNAIFSASFPTTPFSPVGDEKGAGGGGGAGQLWIQALGEIRFGAAGRIEAKGGTGGGGENSLAGGITRIGGGSGGGSGGHVVLESATRIDLSACRSAAPNLGGIYALGGQGGAGANNVGGSPNNGTQTTPQLDVLPSSGPLAAYPTASAPCPMTNAIGYVFTNTVGNPSAPNNGNTLGIVGAGGDGGPGIVQLHAPTLADILPPAQPGETLWKCVKPPPVGASSDDVNTPSAWDRLLPTFGRVSKAQSTWIALGLGTVDPLGGAADPLEHVFGGTDAQGEVFDLALAPISAGTLGAPPSRPYVAQDARTVVFDGATLADDLWLRTPGLLERCELRVVGASQTLSFEVGAAAHDELSGDLLVTVSASGLPLAGAQPGDAVELRPRFFRVASDGVPDVLAPSSSIRLEFQAAGADAQGEADPASASAWVADPAALNAAPGAGAFRFLRFRVTFDLAANGAPLSPATPVPSLDFLRVPFRF